MKCLLIVSFLTLLSCSTTSPNKTRSVANVPPTFDTGLITPYNNVPTKKPIYPIISHHQKEEFELFYLGARHENDLKSTTNKLVDKLFKDYQFDAVIIEPFSYSVGESPAWFLQESREGMTETTIPGGEMALASIRASDKGIPFFGGEINQKETYQALKAKNYTDEDIVGYHLARVIPQWNRDNELKSSFDQKASNYILSKCKSFGIEQSTCPELDKLKIWYKNKTTKELGPEVKVVDIAPDFQSPLFLQKLSAENDIIRNEFTLKVIEDLLRKYKRVAVVYGGAHYTSLKKSIEVSMGTAIEVIRE